MTQREGERGRTQKRGGGGGGRKESSELILSIYIADLN